MKHIISNFFSKIIRDFTKKLINNLLDFTKFFRRRKEDLRASLGLTKEIFVNNRKRKRMPKEESLPEKKKFADKEERPRWTTKTSKNLDSKEIGNKSHFISFPFKWKAQQTSKLCEFTERSRAVNCSVFVQFQDHRLTQCGRFKKMENDTIW